MAAREILKKFGDRVGYSESDLHEFRDNDHRVRHMEKMASAFALYTIEAEVIESRHCNSGHKVGSKFVLDADGNFITKLCPKKMCVYVVSQLIVPVALINERLSESLDPNEFHFMHEVRCLDVGVDCSGYGGIRLRVGVVPRK